MSEANWFWSYPLALVMAAITLTLLTYFKKKGGLKKKGEGLCPCLIYRVLYFLWFGQIW